MARPHPFCLILALGFTLGLPAHAKLFRNAYVSFDLPPNWNCKLEGSEWVCENDFAAKTKEAIIILTAKEVGPSDSLPAYLAQLQTPRNLPGKSGQSVKSQIINVKERMISNHMWIDGLHLGSEIGPYFTRYVATIKDRIAILVTFSAHKEHYTKYSGDFIKAIESLKVVATKDTLPGHQGSLSGTPGAPGAGGGTLGGNLGGTLSGAELGLPSENTPSKADSSLTKVLGFAVICLAIGLYLFTRRGGGGGKPKGKPKARGKSK